MTLVVAYGGFLFAFEELGQEAYKILALPMIVVAALYGMKRGVLFTILYMGFNMGITYTVLPLDYRPPSVADPLGGAVLGLVISLALGTISDMYRKIVRLNDELRGLALADPLTHLHNRRYLREATAKAVEHFLIKKTSTEVRKRTAKIEDAIYGVLLLDVDYFKSVNDTYGHEAGDAVLVALAELLKSTVRFDDVVVRWGGEEFLIILMDTERPFLAEFCRKLRKRVAALEVSVGNDQTVSLTISAGCVPFPFYGDSPEVVSFEQCINLADRLLYIAKQNGRDKAVLAFPGDEKSTYESLLDQVESWSPGEESSLRYRVIS